MVRRCWNTIPQPACACRNSGKNARPRQLLCHNADNEAYVDKYNSKVRATMLLFTKPHGSCIPRCPASCQRVGDDVNRGDFPMKGEKVPAMGAGVQRVATLWRGSGARSPSGRRWTVQRRGLWREGFGEEVASPRNGRAAERRERFSRAIFLGWQRGVAGVETDSARCGFVSSAGFPTPTSLANRAGRLLNLPL